MYGRVEVQTYKTFISASAGEKWSTFITSNFTLQKITTGSHLWKNVWPPQKLHYYSPAIVISNELFQPSIICFMYL
jgi:hypothetical protein